MIPGLAPRRPEQRNRPSFRVLLCRSGEGRGCGKVWTANGEQQLRELLAQREIHESLCATGVFAGTAPATGSTAATHGAPRR